MRKLYEGNLFPASSYKHLLENSWKDSKRYSDFVERLNKIDTELSKQLVCILKEQRQIFSEACETIFIDGFRLGTQMMIETLMDQEDS